MIRSLTETLQTLPAERDDCLLPEIRKLLDQSGRMIVVLDDDPTGTQTVQDVPVLTEWSIEALTKEFARQQQIFFILTNSRSLPSDEAEALTQAIARNLKIVTERFHRPLTVISRCDSTLRGHYPTEVNALAMAIGQPDAVQIIMPFFLQGGRLTIDDVHYVTDSDQLIPASETPFAQDAAFGFKNSNLIEWVIEKQGGRVGREQICSIGLKELRIVSPEALADRLKKLPAKQICIVNAVTTRDVESFVMAASIAELAGQTFLYRTAASFVQSYAGLESRPLLDKHELVNNDASAGLIVIGSYVPKTNSQFDCLIESADELEIVLLEVNDLIGSRSEQEISTAILNVNRHLSAGRSVAICTSRDLVTGNDAGSSLKIGNSISDALVQIVRGINQPLRFLIAKGGITSSDVATKSLGVRRALVLGQILPGVPVWKLQEESSQPGLSYIVFPGNVGCDDALLRAYQKLR